MPCWVTGTHTYALSCTSQLSQKSNGKPQETTPYLTVRPQGAIVREMPERRRAGAVGSPSTPEARRARRQRDS
eukprot:12603139-Alexandrium_andersonii.AAC.1